MWLSSAQTPQALDLDEPPTVIRLHLVSPLLLAFADKVGKVQDASKGLLGRWQDLVLGEQESVAARVSQLDSVRVLDSAFCVCPTGMGLKEEKKKKNGR